VSDLLPRIESTATGGIVLVDVREVNIYGDPIRSADLTKQQEDANGLPELLTETILGLLPLNGDYEPNYKTMLRLIAEYAGANYESGFRAGRLAERAEIG